MAFQFKFDPNQDFQLDAIQSVVDVFDGLSPSPVAAETALAQDVIPNLPPGHSLSESWLLDNVLAVKQRNGIPRELLAELAVDDGMVLDGVGYDSWRYPSFTVEMETGTGKTYVYLRTIHELRRRYGFTKFVVVVPSIAIYEGVIKHFETTRAHFAALYSNETVNLIRYDGSRLSALRGFATATSIQIMVMTIDAFNKSTNRIYRPSEQLPGERLPYQYIQETRPILILDEPQNLESDRAKEALRTLHPLFALRFSATHRSTPNLLYQLTPFQAFRRGLVKRIQVAAVTARDDFNLPVLALQSVSRSPLRATVQVHVTEQGKTRQAAVTLNHGDDLFAKTRRDEHRHGYRVAEISARTGDTFVAFENGVILRPGDTIDVPREEIFRVQIDRTVHRHMEWQEQLLAQGVKVLSLFFIDRVANYVDKNGVIARLFDHAFDKHKQHYPHFGRFAAAQVRDGYFAKRKKKGSDVEEAFDTDSSNQAERDAERAAFELIMRDKERLLSLDEPVSFVFAHSALKEGWDNPNVFQICTLNQTVSEIKKRQEIGRGLRLSVTQAGDRIFDEDVNVLTVVANESYDTYVSTLQAEYVADGVTELPPPPTKAGKAVATRNDRLFTGDAFHAFWAQLSQRLDYRIHVDTPVLVEACVERLNNITFPKPIIVVETGGFVVTKFTLTLESVAGAKARIRLDIEDTAGDTSTHTGHYQVKHDLASMHHQPLLRGFEIVTIADAADPHVVFSNQVTLRPGAPFTFETEQGQRPAERAQLAPEHRYPVFNLLDRAARETGLTRPTINTIFRRLTDARQSMLLANPEGFANVFIAEIRNALADHIVDRIEFIVTGDTLPCELEALFPPSREFPQRELVEAGDHALYDHVQTDSDVEVNFVNYRLKPDERVICFFKFPPAFRLHFPKIIGNYNPDWGVIRRGAKGERLLQLVRETKGGPNLALLQFPTEKRKVQAAAKHFQALGLDYRHVDDKTVDWYLPAPDQPPLPPAEDPPP